MLGPPKQNEFESEAGPAICQNIAGALSINDVSVRARVLTFNCVFKEHGLSWLTREYRLLLYH